MLNFLFSQFLFYVSLALVLFLPGYFLILATKQRQQFSALEKFVLSAGTSITLVNFAMIAIGKAGLTLNRISLLGFLGIFSLSCFGIFFFFAGRKKSQTNSPAANSLQKSTVLVVLIIFLTIFIKSIYFQSTIFPTSTDLGHHMYWTKQVIDTGKIPVYEEADIQPDNTIGTPQPIADFIIGEHLIFAAIGILSGVSVISAFPMLTLFFIHILTLLAIYVLAKFLFQKSPHGEKIALTALFLIGPLYALASPQAKFVSGGVIGNTIGNFFIILLLLLFCRALSEKRSSLLAWALFLSFGLAYTHHLSTFLFIFIAFFSVLAFSLLNYRTLLANAKQWLRLFLSPWVFAVLTLGVLFVFFLYTPTYLNPSAIDTAVGSPVKATRTGLTFAQFQATIGEARFAFALIGFLLLIFAKFLGKYQQAFLLGWLASISIMTLHPDWLFIDIPSNRIASYVVFPAAVIAAYLLVTFFGTLKTITHQRQYLKPTFSILAFFVFLSFLVSNGFYDNSQSLNPESSASDALSTYAAAKYLAARTDDNDVILKDHNYLSGDAWIKLFFMRGYNYPLSRGYFKRYQDETKTREQCTNLMISLPASQEATECFDKSRTNFVMLNPEMDKPQFSKLHNFWQVYSDEKVAIFFKQN